MQAVFAKYGSRVRSIRSSYYVFQINQTTRNIPLVKHTDITFETIGSEDFFIIPQWDIQNHKTFSAVIKTSEVAGFYIVDDNSDYLDPYIA